MYFRSKFVICASIVLCLTAASLSAQTRTPGEPRIGPPPAAGGLPDAMQIFGAAGPAGRLWELKIRKSFASRLDEQKPAALSIETAGEGRDTYHVDLAVGRYYGNENTRLRFAPAIEWHRSSTASAPKNKLSAAVNTDIRLAGDQSRLVPFFRGQASAIRDIQVHETGATAALLLSMFTRTSDQLDGSAIIVGGRYLGTYYPYAGIELFRNHTIAGATGVDAEMAMGQFEIKLYPFNRAADTVDSPLELVGSIGRRQPLGDDDLEDEYNFITLGANFYLDRAQRFALGFEYYNGADPGDNFVAGHKGVLSFRVKI